MSDFQHFSHFTVAKAKHEQVVPFTVLAVSLRVSAIIIRKKGFGLIFIRVAHAFSGSCGHLLK